jgi:hypothetical protein
MMLVLSTVAAPNASSEAIPETPRIKTSRGVPNASAEGIQVAINDL